MGKKGSLKRVFSVFVYMILFVFSIYSIIQIRYFYAVEKPITYLGNFTFLFISSTMPHTEFILTKLTLFALTGALSFILMLTNYYFYQNPHHDYYNRLDKEIKDIRKKATV
jgi:hypothetical protein